MDGAGHVHVTPEHLISPQPFLHLVPTQFDIHRLTSNASNKYSPDYQDQVSMYAAVYATGTRELVAFLTVRLDIEDAEAKARFTGNATPHVSPSLALSMQVVLRPLTP